MAFDEIHEKVAVGVSVTSILAAIAWGRSRIVAWWKKPSLASSIVQLSEALQGFGHELGVLKQGFQDASYAATIARDSARALLDMHNVPMWECEGPDWQCTWVNPALSELFEIPESQCLGFGWLSAIPGNYRQNVMREFRDAIAQGIPYESNYPVIKGNKIVNCVARGKVLIAKDGAKLLVRGTVTPMEIAAA